MLFESVVGWVVGKVLDLLGENVAFFLVDNWVQILGLILIGVGFYVLKKPLPNIADEAYLETVESLVARTDRALSARNEADLVSIRSDLHANFLRLRAMGIKIDKLKGFKDAEIYKRPTTHQAFIFAELFKNMIPYLRTGNHKQINKDASQWLKFSISRIANQENDNT